MDIKTIKDFFLNWAEIFDAWRIAPRSVLIFYCFMVYFLTEWFMGLGAPSAEQSAVVMAAWGAAGLIFNFYAKSGRAWGPQVEWFDGVGQNDYLISQRNQYYGGGYSNGRYGNYHPKNRNNVPRTNYRKKSNNTNHDTEEGDA